MADTFEDHCWQDAVPAETLAVYGQYRRETFIGGPAALVAIDLYELVYQGGDKPVAAISRDFPGTCGEYAYAAIAPTKRLFQAAREAGLPVFYSTGDARPESKPGAVTATRRQRPPIDAALYRIRPEFKPQPGDVVITKQRASAFFGTPLSAHLTQLGIRTVIMCGESTSGCLRASAVDAHSHGFHVVVAEEGCFDRSLISHKINLFDLHHKYADVMHVEAIVAELAALKPRKAV